MELPRVNPFYVGGPWLLGLYYLGTVGFHKYCFYLRIKRLYQTKEVGTRSYL